MSLKSKLEKAFKEVEESLEDFSEEEIKEELEELLKYNVPPDQAAATVIRRYRKTPTKISKKISDIEVGDRGLNIEGRVLERREREIEVKGEKRRLVSGTLADETGTISFTSWIDFPFKKGDAVRIENAYSREWNESPELQVGEYTDIESIEGEEIPSLEGLEKPEKVALNEVRNVYRPKIEATIVDVQDRSGLIMRCPECNRVTEGGKCSEHGEIDPKSDLRIKAILDDGKSCIQATFNREATENLAGITLNEAMEMARNAMDREVVQREMEKTIGKTIVATGRPINNNFVVFEVEKPEMVPEKKAKEILKVIK